TGHYARIRREGATWKLLRGVDRDKDQSYVLSMLTQRELGRIAFPVGELTKAETRSLAAELGLRTAHKAESMHICFVRGGDYRQFLRREAPDESRPGPSVDGDGAVLGQLDGAVASTVAQRRGLGLAAGEPRYVTSIDASTSTVTIGRREDLRVAGIRLDSVTNVDGYPLFGRVQVQYRAHGGKVGGELNRD